MPLSPQRLRCSAAVRLRVAHARVAVSRCVLAWSTHTRRLEKGGGARGRSGGNGLRRERDSRGTVGCDLPTSLGVATGQRTTNPLCGRDNTQTFSILPIASRRRRYPLCVRDLSLGYSDR